jgi:hypothetical protein
MLRHHVIDSPDEFPSPFALDGVRRGGRLKTDNSERNEAEPTRTDAHPAGMKDTSATGEGALPQRAVPWKQGSKEKHRVLCRTDSRNEV